MINKQMFGEKRVAVWGLGVNFKHKENYIRDYINPVLYIDSSSEKTGKVYDGIECCSPDELASHKIDVVVITPEDGLVRNEIREQLGDGYEVYILNYLWDEYEMELQKEVDFGTASDKVVKRFTCGLGNCACNLHCSYCILDSHEEKMKFQAEFNHSVPFMIKALSRNRLGGRALFSIAGGGETLLKPGLIELAYGLLSEGHYIIFTTNGTVTQKINELLAFEPEMVKRMMFTLSMHYLELKENNLLDVFFDNARKIREAGASIELSIVGCDAYLPYIDEIMQMCLEKLGFLPSPIAVRPDNKMATERQLDSKLDKETYLKTWERFSQIKMEAVRALWHEISEECYAGIQTAKLNLQDGWMRQCENDQKRIDNIYDDIKREIQFLKKPHPCNMGCCYCYGIPLSGRTLSTGKIPTNYQLINRVDKNGVSTINETMRGVLDFVNES